MANATVVAASIKGGRTGVWTSRIDASSGDVTADSPFDEQEVYVDEVVVSPLVAASTLTELTVNIADGSDNVAWRIAHGPTSTYRTSFRGSGGLMLTGMRLKPLTKTGSDQYLVTVVFHTKRP